MLTFKLVSLLPQIVHEKDLLLQKHKELEARVQEFERVASELSAQTPGLQDAFNGFQTPARPVAFDPVDARIPPTPQTIVSLRNAFAQGKLQCSERLYKKTYLMGKKK